MDSSIFYVNIFEYFIELEYFFWKERLREFLKGSRFLYNIFSILWTFHEDVKMNNRTRNGEYTTLPDTTTILNPIPYEQNIFV